MYAYAEFASISYDYKWAYTSFTACIVMWDDRIICKFHKSFFVVQYILDCFAHGIFAFVSWFDFFLGSISSRYDKNFSNFGLSSSFRLFVIYSIRFSGFEYFSAAFSSIRFEWWMISSYFCMAFASSLVFRSLLFGSSLYESLNFLKAWTLHRHLRFRLYCIRRMRLILDIRYILLGILLDSLLIL